jgi:hypothetical protein
MKKIRRRVLPGRGAARGLRCPRIARNNLEAIAASKPPRQANGLHQDTSFESTWKTARSPETGKRPFFLSVKVDSTEKGVRKNEFQKSSK